MSDPPSGSLTTEVSWEGNRDAIVWVGIFPLHHYWPLLAPFFGDALLPPQRRMEGEVVAWTWRPVKGPLTPEELSSLRRRLGSDLEALADRVSDGGGRADLADVAAEMQRVVLGWADLSDGEFSRFVARTSVGLRLHSWSATQAPEARDPSTGAAPAKGPESSTGERNGAPIRNHRTRWIALALLLIFGLGAWWRLHRPKAGPVEPNAPAMSEPESGATADVNSSEAKSEPEAHTTGGELGADGSVAGQKGPAIERFSPPAAVASTNVETAAGGSATGGSSAAAAGNSNRASAGKGGDSPAAITLPPMTLQAGPASHGQVAPATSSLPGGKGSVPPASSGLGPNSDQSPSANSSSLPGSKGGGPSPGAASAAPADMSPSSSAPSAGGTAPTNSAAPSGAQNAPSASPSLGGSAFKSDESPADQPPVPAGASPANPPGAQPDNSAPADANANADAAASDAVDGDRGRTAKKAPRASGNADGGDADADAPQGDHDSHPAPAANAAPTVAVNPTANSPDSFPKFESAQGVKLTLTPWKAELLSDRILPTLPTESGASLASMEAERRRELAAAQARLRLLRVRISFKTRLRVEYLDGKHELLSWPGSGLNTLAATRIPVPFISCATPGVAEIEVAGGAQVYADLICVATDPAALRTCSWQTEKGVPLPNNWTLTSTPTELTLSIPVASLRPLSPDPSDFPLALTDSDSGWSFVATLTTHPATGGGAHGPHAL